MTLDQLQQRDARIAELEARGRARTPAEQEELGRLIYNRDCFWRRLPLAAATARRRLAELEAYARRHRLPIEESAPCRA